MKNIREQIDNMIDVVAGAYLGAVSGHESIEKLQIAAHTLDVVRENNADLQLAADDVGWQSLSSDATQRLVARPTLDQITRLARLMYLLNPLIKRAVTVQELYVWGSGVSVKADDKSPELQETLDNFFNDPGNQCALGNTNAWSEREREQRIEGNVFFVFFFNRLNGAIRVRTTTIDEIIDIYCNPEDKNEPWFYLRQMPDSSGTKWYPDANYNPKFRTSPIGSSVPVDWAARILHVKTGGLPGMKFGISELYSVLNWATAYKGILENFATILKAYAKIAWKLTGQKTAKGVAAAKSKFNTGITTGDEKETNPTPNVASMMISSGAVDLSAVKTANSTTGPDEARALRSMVAAGTDTPEHFFGDSDIGNLATSTTLDRPTELKMIARQQMWAAVMNIIVRIVMESSIRAPYGLLRKAGYGSAPATNQFDSQSVNFTAPTGKSIKVAVKFPAILERNVTDRVRAVVQAATLGGSPAEGIIPDRKLLFKLLLEALGEKDADYITGQMYPDSVKQGFKDPAETMKNETKAADARLKAADAQMKKAENPTAASASNP